MNTQSNYTQNDNYDENILKLKRERFRCQIRKSKNDELFQLNRSRFQNLNMSHEPIEQISNIQDTSRMEQAIKSFNFLVEEQHFSQVEDQITEIIEIYQNLRYNCSEQFLKEGFILQLCFSSISQLIYCLNPERQKYQSMQVLVCQLLCQIIAFFDMKDLNHNIFIDQVILLNDQLINNLSYILDNPINIELRQQGVLCLGNLLLDSQEFAEIFFTESKFVMILKVAMNENNLFQDIIWLISSLGNQLGKLSLQTLEPLFEVMDRYLCFEDIELEMQVLNTIKKILQNSENTNDFAKRCVRMRKFAHYVEALNCKHIAPQIIQFVMTIYGNIEDYYEFCNNEKNGYFLTFNKLLSCMDSNLSSGESSLRLITYWSLSNLILNQACIKSIIQHPYLIDKIIIVSLGENLNCKEEISFIFLNLITIGTIADSVVLLNKGLLQILLFFIQDRQLKANTTKIILHLMEQAQIANQDTSQNEFNDKLKFFKRELEDINMEKILLDDQEHSDQVQNQIQYFFMNN